MQGGLISAPHTVVSVLKFANRKVPSGPACDSQFLGFSLHLPFIPHTGPMDKQLTFPCARGFPGCTSTDPSVELDLSTAY